MDADRATVIKALRYARLRLTDLQRLFRHRHGSAGLPNNDQGRTRFHCHQEVANQMGLPPQHQE
jgi:hypothetical protein